MKNDAHPYLTTEQIEAIEADYMLKVYRAAREARLRLRGELPPPSRVPRLARSLLSRARLGGQSA